MQTAQILRPEQGAVIRDSGGLRKVRWRTAASGKRGGIREIYYWEEASETFYMLFAYAKATQDDLSRGQLRILRQIVRE